MAMPSICRGTERYIPTLLHRRRSRLNVKITAATTASPPSKYTADNPEKPIANPCPGGCDSRSFPITHGASEPISMANIDIPPTAEARCLGATTSKSAAWVFAS